MTIEQRAIIRRILSEEYIRNLDRARDYQCKGLPAFGLGLPKSRREDLETA